MTDGFIPPHGGYKKLLSYQRAGIVYDATVRFCQRFLDRRDRTVDQMIQAARSGKTEYHRGEHGLGHVQGDGAQADERRAGESGGATGRLS